MPWEDVKTVFRPETVHMGVMRVDAEKCTKCGLCIQNCPFKAWETGPDDIPRQKEEYECFSCFNCMVCCPVDAVSIVDTYHVDNGVFRTEPYPLPVKKPLEPLSAQGKSDKWTPVERTIFERRSVRNFRDRPVPDTLIRRVIEAGRFAPSAGNCQPWKFIVITNRDMINEMDEAIYRVLNMQYNTYIDDELVKNLARGYESNPNPGGYDPRIILGGIGSVAKRNLPPLLNAPVVILIAGDSRAISGPQLNIGICGQNMNLAATSLGLGSCWVGFSAILNMARPIMEKLGLESPWRIINAVLIGYPRFKQSGVVPREYRPVTWLRSGSDTIEIEE